MAFRDDLITTELGKVNRDWSFVPLDDGWLLVTTSHQFSDGDHVELLVRRNDRSVEISDGGEALARLDLAGISVERGRARDMWRRLLRAHEVELHNERLTVEGSVNDLGALVDGMANAIANIDGIRMLAPPPKSPQFAERLVTFFQSEFEYVEESPQLNGQSGGLYRATAAVGDQARPTIVQAVAGSSPRSRRSAVEHAYTMFSDVNGALPKTQKLVVLSDTDWKDEQKKLLSTVAYVGSWLHRDRFVSFIGSSQQSGSYILMPNQESFTDK